MKIKSNNNGFTLIELLGVITILGILMTLGIVNFSGLIGKAKDTHTAQLEKTLTTAAESYVGDNSDKLPKQVGDSRDISAQTLKDANYIREEIKNANGESCMSNSFVKVYKVSKTDYTYTAFLYCGSETPTTTSIPEPTVNVYFSNIMGGEHMNNTQVLNNFDSTSIFFELTGGKDLSTNKVYEIDGFSFSILAKYKNNSTLSEIYNSGSISVQRAKSFTYSKPLKECIDATGITYIEVRVSVNNVAGGKKIYSTSGY